MIYAAIKPIDQYSVAVVEGGVTMRFGLYDSYHHRPELLALVMIATQFPYDYEGCRPDNKCRVSLNRIEALEETLKCVVGGTTIAQWLKELTPLEFYNLMEKADLSDLPITVKLYSGSVDAVKAIIGARAAAWGLAYRGRLRHKGNVTFANFGGTKNNIQVPEKLKLLHHRIKEGLTL